MVYRPILGTLGYVLSPDKERVLLVHRNRRENDYHTGKYNGLGGKMEPHEDVVSCIKREIKEEAGIDCVNVKLRGTVNWQGFGPDGADWLGFVFLIDEYTGIPLQENDEGMLVWAEINKLHELPMWDGDRHFLPLVFDEDPRPFHGYLPYKDGVVCKWSFERI